MDLRGIMVMVAVQDIDRALRFYRDTMGLTVEEEGETWVFFVQGVGLQLAPEPLQDVDFRMNSVMLTLIVTDLEQAIQDLRARNVDFFTLPNDEIGMKLASFRDSEYNLVQLIEIS